MTFNEKIITQIPSVSHIYRESLSLDEPFITLAGRFAQFPGTVVLLSGGDLDCARFHIMAIRPWLSYRGKGDYLQVKIKDHKVAFRANPITAFKQILNAGRGKLKSLPKPVQAGLFGYLAYDLKTHLETLPQTTIDDLCLPEICFFAPSLIVVEDRKTKLRFLYRIMLDGWDKKEMEIHYKWFKDICESAIQQPISFEGIPATLQSNFSKQDYLSTLDQIHEYIASGDIYQVNLSQRFSMAYKGNGFELFCRLFSMNPAPFFAYINAGDHEIVSTSPERFLYQNGRLLETRPIKGTRKRGCSKQEDLSLYQELVKSPKEDAELSMIVDLMRNDLGRVCRKGSVQVMEHKRVETYQNVFHLISIVKGELADEKDSVDVIAATFPGGSITGCPKVRAMEIIDELEPTCRHVYTGSIGYVSFHDTMDLSIAIRTAILTKNRIHFGVGGGIVFDSQPIEEFEETLHKGKTLMAVCMNQRNERKNNSEKIPNRPRVWFNGTLIPADQATISIMDSGFQYGNGFFETIRAEKGEPLRLEKHLKRFEHTWNTIYIDSFPNLSWRYIITQVLKKNNLSQKTAVVKIISAQTESNHPPYHPHIIISARSYTHRLKLLKRKGLKLGIYPHPRQTPLAEHKTLNYLYYYQAGQWARARGFDEALILNPDGSLSETNTGNIFIVRKNTIIEPISPCVLPGIMAEELREKVVKTGGNIVKKSLNEENISTADQVWVTNALMGVVPVIKFEGVDLKFSEDLYQTLVQSLKLK